MRHLPEDSHLTSQSFEAPRRSRGNHINGNAFPAEKAAPQRNGVHTSSGRQAGHPAGLAPETIAAQAGGSVDAGTGAVSYTHLTLPTILRV